MPLPESEAFNVRFVQVVETYKCLYDTTLPDYTNKDEQDKAWAHVAHAFTASSNECKVRWKHLRGGMTRYIRKRKDFEIGQAPRMVKQFYLWDAMQFVVPFLKSRHPDSQGPCSPALPEGLGSEEGYGKEDGYGKDEGYGNESYGNLEAFANAIYGSEMAHHDIKEEAQDPDSFYEAPNECQVEISECQSPSPSSRRGRKRAKSPPDPTKQSPPEPSKRTPPDTMERVVVDCVDIFRRFLDQPDDADLSFFKSLLPDMKDLNPSQKRRFKQKVLQLLDEISSEGSNSAYQNNLT